MSRPLSEVGLHFQKIRLTFLSFLRSTRVSSTAGRSLLGCGVLIALQSRCNLGDWSPNSRSPNSQSQRCLYTGGGSHGIEFATDHVRSIGVWARVLGGGAVEILILIDLIWIIVLIWKLLFLEQPPC